MPPSPSCSSARRKRRRGIASRRSGARRTRPLCGRKKLSDIAAAGRSLTELAGIGRSLAKRLHNWIASPPEVEVPAIRREFLTLAQARRVLKRNPGWAPQLNGDLQMHTTWSDGGGTIADMAAAAIERGYKFIGITDHTQGLKHCWWS